MTFSFIGAFPRYLSPNTIRRRKSSENSNNSPFGDPFAQAFNNNNAPMTPAAAAAAAANSKQDQYPYPTSNSLPVENHGPAVPPTSLLVVAGTNENGAPQETSNGMGAILSQTGPGLPSGPAQTTSFSSTTSSTSSSTFSSSSSTSFTSRTTLVAISSTQAHRGPADAQSPIFLSQTFADTYAPSTSDVQPSSTSTATTTPLHLSATAVGLLLSLAGFVSFVVSICLIRIVRRQIRNHRRRLHERVFDFAGSAEKGGAWDSDDGDGRTINNSSSPSTIFGGKERTGLTPIPSWTAFPEGNGNGNVAPSPYPLGLVPPPTVMHQSLSPLHAQSGVGLGVVNKGGGVPPRQQGFSPPTITVTTSSPRSSSLAVPQQGLISSSSSGISTCGSFNRVSVYDHPEHGAQLVRPPKLAVVNDDSGQEARYSGWSSWDDSVGVELGVKMDRKHPVKPGQKSRRPHGRGRISALKSTLAPVPEASDSFSSDMERHDGPPARLDPVHHRENRNSPSRLHPNGSVSGNHHPQRSSPVSPLSLSIKSSPSKSLRSLSPRSIQSQSKPTPNSLLYDLPQFDNLSPTLGGITRTNSSNSDSDYQRSNNAARYRPQRRSAVKSKGRSHTRNSRQKEPSLTISEALLETYAYVYSYGGSDDDKEEVIQARRRSKRASAGGSRKKSASSPRSGTSHSPISRVNKEVIAASPGVHASVGALMLAAYEDEELMHGASSSASSRKLGGKHKERMGVLEDSTNVKDGSSAGLGVRVEKAKVAHSTSGPSSQHQYDRRQGGDEEAKGRITQAQAQAHSHYDQRGVPAHLSTLPRTVPESNLSHQQQQMRNVAAWPEYQYRSSPTYSVYGMYYGTMPRSPLDGTAEYL